MPDKNYYTRYAHSEGITSLCFDDSGQCMLTCGSDGDVRIWKGLEDDDPKSHRVGEAVYSIVSNKDRFFVATDTSSVLSYTFPDGILDGTVARFSAIVNHLSISTDGASLLAGSSDFSIKLVDVSTKSFKVFLGHDAPILSVALDPCSDFVASSSCDGTLRVWRIAKQTCVKSWPSVFESSNEFSASKVLCRIDWQPTSGKLLAVPFGNTVKLFGRDNWEETSTLKDSSVTELINVVRFTKCGRYLAAGCVDGTIAAWDVVRTKFLGGSGKPEKGYPICSVEWNRGTFGTIVFCDFQGRLGSFDKISPSDLTGDVERSVDEIKDLPGDDLDLFDDDDDENSFSISKIKAETVGLEDFTDAGIGQKAAVGEETGSVARPLLETVHARCSKFADSQEPFQSGSTPTYYSKRFMMWNSVGIVVAYNTEEENTIDVEFHDVSVHHSLHLDNVLGYSMADVSETAVLLACESQSEVPSKLMCMHFASWDNNKEWTVDMPEEENVQAIAVSDKFAAVATDARNLRLFSIGGIQRQVLTIPGPIVTMSAQNERLVVAYHRAVGLPGDQCLGAIVVEIKGNDVVVATVCQLPLSPQATLMWIGLSDEGTPCSADSKGIVRVLPKSPGQLWIEVANTKAHVKVKSDNYFVVGLGEKQQLVRCVLCKGSRYPSIVPRPNVTVISFRMPLCELKTEKSQLEETIWRQALLLETLSELVGDRSSDDDDVRISLEASAQKTQKESLIKLFALSCRSGHEFRSVEVCQAMDSYNTVQLAIKYATQRKCLRLADRLGEVAYEKMGAEIEEVEDRVPEVVPLLSVTRSRITTQGHEQAATAGASEEDREDEEEEDDGNERVNQKKTTTTTESLFSSPMIQRQNPFLKKCSKVVQQPATHRTFDYIIETNSLPKIPSAPLLPPPKKESKQRTLVLTNKSSEAETRTSKTGVELWIEATKEKVAEENPGLDDHNISLLAIKQFKALPTDEKKEWMKKARDNPQQGKRKRNEEEQSHSTKQARSGGDKIQSSTISKLKSFSHSQK